MNRKILIALTLIVVFVLPSGWYVFLRFYGENKYDLPVITEWSQSCVTDHSQGKATLYYFKNSVISKPNEWKRITGKLEEASQYITLTKGVEDCFGSFDLVLVDEDGKVRGEYKITREETDRLLTEVDIYILNQQDKNSINH